ncbi:MAG: sulfite exporter TauE/SafE family protein [Bacteroidia bacterium]
MLFISIICALLIGLVIGLLGGGGGVLAMLSLTYILGFTDVGEITAMNLVIVGIGSLIGAGINLKRGLVDIRSGLVFAIPSFITVYLTRLLLHELPENVWFTLGSIDITKRLFVLGLFAIVMLISGYLMLKPGAPPEARRAPGRLQYILAGLAGAAVGLLSGLTGAGGGFLVVPALVLLLAVPFKTAVGTTQLVLGVKSVVGFLADVVHSPRPINWGFLSPMIAFTIVGVAVGLYFSQHIPAKKLKRAFGFFVIVLGALMLYWELS